MESNNVNDYGWGSDDEPDSGSYIFPVIIKILKDLSLSRVLDVGSGNGALCKRLKDEGYQVAGIENDRAGYELSRTLYKDMNFYHFGVQDDPGNLMREEEKFDAVVSTEVIEHLYAPNLLPQYSHDVLKKGGCLVISTPYHGYLKNLVIALLDKYDSHHNPLWHGGHIKFWSKRTLTTLLESNGFKVVAIYGVGRMPILWKSMIVVAVKSAAS